MKIGNILNLLGSVCCRFVWGLVCFLTTFQQRTSTQNVEISCSQSLLLFILIYIIVLEWIQAWVNESIDAFTAWEQHNKVNHLQTSHFSAPKVECWILKWEDVMSPLQAKRPSMRCWGWEKELQQISKMCTRERERERVQTMSSALAPYLSWILCEQRLCTILTWS